jgi:hypothetical protein
VTLPREGSALVGTQFLVLGKWWKGATHQQRQTLYAAKCVAFDVAHPFVTYKRKPDLTRVRTESLAPAIQFVLTREQDHAWNNDNLWMTLTQYAQVCFQYDERALEPEAEQPPKKKPRHGSPPPPLGEPTAASVVASSSALSRPSSAAAATDVGEWRFKVLAMPDSYQRCSSCFEQHRGRISCWRTCGMKQMRRKLAHAAKAAGNAAAPATVPSRREGTPGGEAVPAALEPAPEVKREREWAPPPPRNKKGMEAYAVAKQLLKTPCAFKGKLFTAGSRVKWLKIFANALDHDHGRLARHLVILEQNLPWRAVTEDFGHNRPQFVHQVNAVKGPLEARLVLETLSRFIRVDDDGHGRGKRGAVGFADVLMGSLAATGDKAVVRAGDAGASGERVKRSHKKIVLGKLLPSSPIPRPHAVCSTARFLMRSEGRQLPNKGEK